KKKDIPDKLKILLDEAEKRIGQAKRSVPKPKYPQKVQVEGTVDEGKDKIDIVDMIRQDITTAIECVEQNDAKRAEFLLTRAGKKLVAINRTDPDIIRKITELEKELKEALEYLALLKEEDPGRDGEMLNSQEKAAVPNITPEDAQNEKKVFLSPKTISILNSMEKSQRAGLLGEIGRMTDEAKSHSRKLSPYNNVWEYEAKNRYKVIFTVMPSPMRSVIVLFINDRSLTEKKIRKELGECVNPSQELKRAPSIIDYKKNLEMGKGLPAVFSVSAAVGITSVLIVISLLLSYEVFRQVWHAFLCEKVRGRYPAIAAGIDWFLPEYSILPDFIQKPITFIIKRLTREGKTEEDSGLKYALNKASELEQLADRQRTAKKYTRAVENYKKAIEWLNKIEDPDEALSKQKKSISRKIKRIENKLAEFTGRRTNKNAREPWAQSVDNDVNVNTVPNTAENTAVTPENPFSGFSGKILLSPKACEVLWSRAKKGPHLMKGERAKIIECFKGWQNGSFNGVVTIRTYKGFYLRGIGQWYRIIFEIAENGDILVHDIPRKDYRTYTKLSPSQNLNFYLEWEDISGNSKSKGSGGPENVVSASHGPAMFVDPETFEIRSLKGEPSAPGEMSEHRALNKACDELVFQQHKEPLEGSDPLCSFVNEKDPEAKIYILDDEALKKALTQKGHPKLAEGLVTHAGTYRDPVTGEIRAHNLFVPLSVYKLLIEFLKTKDEFPGVKRALNVWREHELEHFSRRETDTDADFGFEENKSKTAIEILNRIRDRISEKNYDEARNLLLEVYEIFGFADSSGITTFLTEIDTFIEQKDTDDALKTIQKTIDILQGRDIPRLLLFISRAMVFWEKNDTKEAIIQLEEALKFNMEFVFISYLEAEISESEKQWSDVYRFYTQVLVNLNIAKGKTEIGHPVEQKIVHAFLFISSKKLNMMLKKLAAQLGIFSIPPSAQKGTGAYIEHNNMVCLSYFAFLPIVCGYLKQRVESDGKFSAEEQEILSLIIRLASEDKIINPINPECGEDVLSLIYYIAGRKKLMPYSYNVDTAIGYFEKSIKYSEAFNKSFPLLAKAYVDREISYASYLEADTVLSLARNKYGDSEEIRKAQAYIDKRKAILPDFEHARQLFEDGDYNNAITCMNKAKYIADGEKKILDLLANLEKQIAECKKFFDQGMEQFKAGKFNHAIAAFDKVFKRNPSDDIAATLKQDAEEALAEQKRQQERKVPPSPQALPDPDKGHRAQVNKHFSTAMIQLEKEQLLNAKSRLERALAALTRIQAQTAEDEHKKMEIEGYIARIEKNLETVQRENGGESRATTEKSIGVTTSSPIDEKPVVAGSQDKRTRVILTKKVIDTLDDKQLPGSTLKRICEGLLQIAAGDKRNIIHLTTVKKLWRLKVSDYRIIFTYIQGDAVVLKISKRAENTYIDVYDADPDKYLKEDMTELGNFLKERGVNSDFGPALFVDTRVRDYPQGWEIRALRGDVEKEQGKISEHTAVNNAFDKLVFLKRGRKTIGPLKKRDIVYDFMCSPEFMKPDPERSLNVTIYVVDDAAFRNELPNEYRYIADGLVGHAGTYLNPKTQKRSRNLFISASTYKFLEFLLKRKVKTDKELKMLKWFREHELCHYNSRSQDLDAELTPDEKTQAKTMLLLVKTHKAIED
ncbi:MAG: hypothetical protein PHW46_04160, partial [Candidatus Omnitrophica bacterium]|nr:hypothetical protein [Candidatus Omnitrophota bacterium]